MTEDESELLHNVKNDYWHAFSALVGATLNRVPAHLRDDLLERLQESSSVYGSEYEKHVK